MTEIWKDIFGYEGLYQVSTLGRVKSLPKGNYLKNRILNPYIPSHGYRTVGLRLNGKTILITVANLVARTFLNHKPCGKKIVVDHIDNNRLNDNLSNIQLISHRKNVSKDIKNKSSKYTGVSFCKKTQKWYSSIRINGKTKNIGLYENEIEASEAYQNKLKEINYVRIF